MLLDHISEVGNVLVSLGEQVGQTFVLLVVDHLTITFFIFSLNMHTHMYRSGLGRSAETLRESIMTFKGMRQHDTHHSGNQLCS